MEEVVDPRALERYLDNIAGSINEVGYRVDSVSDAVVQVGQDLDETRSDLKNLSKAFYEYVESAKRAVNAQRAETKLGNLKSELDRQYGHYDKVRRTSVGVLQAFDVANVSDAVVSHVSEELMIQSPRYWLAPALVAIAAWSRDDKDIVNKSIDEAFKRNASKTSLFFALILRRMGRNDSALRWLKHYLQSCDSKALTREFAIILEAAAQGAFGKNGANMLSEQIKKWNDDLRLNDDIVQSQVQEWVEELGNNSSMLAPEEYSELRDCCPDFGRLKYMLESATALGNTRDKYQAVKDNMDTTLQASADMLDDLLEQLVTEYDDEELPLRREVAYNEAIVETDGDMDKAEKKADQYKRALEETVDAVTLQTRTAISPDLMGVSVQTQKVSVGSSQQDFLAALNEYTRNYRSQTLNSARIVLDQSHSKLAEVHHFYGYEGYTSDNETVAFNQLHDAWDKTFEDYIKTLKFDNSMLIKPIVFSVIAVVILFLIHATMFAFVVAVCAIAGIAIWASNKQKKSEEAIAKALQDKEKAFEVSRLHLVAARAAFADIQFEYQELNEDEESLRNLIETWPTAMPKLDESQEGEK